MHIEQLFLEGLGHLSYLVTDETRGTATVIDPRRDVEPYLDLAQQAGGHITHILETHLHNDYVSGSCELAARTGAKIVAAADAHLAYDHQPVQEGDALQVGALIFHVLATPGHTPAHVSYLLDEPGSNSPYALFSGGSMLVGSAGRTDLLGPALTMTLTRQQYASLRRLLETLPASVLVYPTHGAGSFCAASSVASACQTTIGQERLASPAAQVPDAEAFVRRQLLQYSVYPRYYAYMKEINQCGPRILGALPAPSAVPPGRVHEWMGEGIPLVDGRSRDAFAAEHLPGSLNIEVSPTFGTYIGWLLPFNAPLLLVLEDEAECREAAVQLIRIGYERIQGYLEGGIAAWKAAGFPVERFAQMDLDTLHTRWEQHARLALLDVRRPEEWQAFHIPGAQHIHVADLLEHLQEVSGEVPVATICASGHRAQIAASIIAASGREALAVQDGVQDWMRQGWPIKMEDAEGRLDALQTEYV